MRNRRLGLGSTRSAEQRAADRAADLRLLQAVLAKEPFAWRAFIRRFRPTIEGAVARVVRRYALRVSKSDREDLAAEVWPALLHDDCAKLRRYDALQPASVASWIARIAAQTTIDRLRAWGRQRLSRVELAKLSSHQGRGSDPDYRIKWHEFAKQLSRVYADLTSEDRRFLLLCIRHDWSVEPIARGLELSHAAVYTRKHRLQARLRTAAQQLEVGALPPLSGESPATSRYSGVLHRSLDPQQLLFE